MKRKIIIYIILCLIYALTSCGCVATNIDFEKRPSNLNLDYWFNEKIDLLNLDESHLYESGKFDSYLDSKYNFVIEKEEKKLPKTYVLYDINLEKSMLHSITITDPSISIYGLSMNSSEGEIQNMFLNLGFTYLEYSGLYPSYSNGKVEITINNSLFRFSLYSDLI